MNQTDSNTYYFEHSPIWKAIAHMSLPMMLGLCLNVFYNLVDAFFIGKLNQTQMLSAVALALPFMTIQMAIGNVFGIGGGTYISRLLGEKSHDTAKIVSSVTFYLSLIAGLLLIIICLPILHPILQVLGAKGDTIQPTREFILVFLIGSPVVIANFALGEVVRAEGASKESMYGMTISVIVNIILDPILIFLCHMGVAGAAAATVVGNLCAVIYYVFYLQKKSMFLTVSPKAFKPNLEVISGIFKIGITALIQSLFMIVSTLLLNNFSIQYGEYVVAAFGISLRVAQISDFIGMGLFMGVIPLIAYSYTAGDIKRMKKIIQSTALYITVLVLIITLIMMIFRIQVFEFFSEDPQVIQVGVNTLAALLISSLFVSISGLFIGIFQGVGREKEASILSMAEGVLLIPTMIVGNIFLGLNGVIWSITIAQSLTCLIGLALWIHFKKDPSMKSPVLKTQF
jgi:putative MATE family efflux protein